MGLFQIVRDLQKKKFNLDDQIYFSIQVYHLLCLFECFYSKQILISPIMPKFHQGVHRKSLDEYWRDHQTLNRENS